MSLDSEAALWHRISQLDEHERLALLQQAKPRIVDPYIGQTPHPVQQVFLSLTHEREVFLGGGGGGGKSSSLLAAALQYVDVPGYAALILRKSWADLIKEDAIMERAETWLTGTPARKRFGGRLWEFPTGAGRKPATLSFGHLQFAASVEQYRSAAYQSISVDEVSQIEERTYEFMFSRLRGPALPCEHCPRQVEKTENDWRHKDLLPGVRVRTCDNPTPKRIALQQYPPSRMDGVTTLFDVPLRMRSAANPSTRGMWVKDRFVDPETRRKGVVFVPSKMTDNPSLNQQAYRESLSHMGNRERLAMEEGLWDIPNEDAMLKREWFGIVEDWPREGTRYCRYWDLAATAPAPGKDPDWTVGALLALTTGGVWYVVDIRRTQARSADIERLVTATAVQDVERCGGVRGRVLIGLEQEPGSSGKAVVATFRKLLAGYPFNGDRPTGSKVERARPLAVAAENENVRLLRAAWNRILLDEAESFPPDRGGHDDQIDAIAGAMNMLVPAKGRARLLV